MLKNLNKKEKECATGGWQYPSGWGVLTITASRIGRRDRGENGEEEGEGGGEGGE